MWTLRICSGALVAAAWAGAWAAEIDTGPAKTRPEMKLRIEGLKQRESRLPLPGLTAEEAASGRRFVNNGRLRSLYLPESWQANRSATPNSQAGRSSASRPSAQQQAPDYPFKTRLFWVVSRTNDCQYCLGHQELKLRRAGMTEDQIASLDCRWSTFPQDEQQAMRLARLITLTPHLVTDQDLAELKKHYTDVQIVDIIQSIAGNNSTNRWTASTGIPQDRSFGGDEPSELNTPTSAEFSQVETKVAPLDYKPRPAWESRGDAEAAMAACQSRTPLVKLPSIDAARQALASDTPGIVPPVWCQVLAYSPPQALRAWRHRQAVVRDGKLDANLKALIAWVTARENRSWYSAAHAKARLNAMGISDDVLYSIGSDEATFTPVERATFSFARKLTSAPHTIVDDDVAGLRKQFSDHEVAEIIFLVCDGNSFDRITEMLRLPLEGGATTVGQAR